MAAPAAPVPCTVTNHSSSLLAALKVARERGEGGWGDTGFLLSA